MWGADRRSEAMGRGLNIFEDEETLSQFGDDGVIVSSHRLVTMRSDTRGETWERQVWDVPGFTSLSGFPRGIILEDGRTWLFPIYTSGGDGLIFRSADGGRSWRLHLAVPKVCNEWSLVEVSPGRVLAHIRHGHRWEDSEPDIAGTHRDELGTNYTLETWSDDACDTPPPSGPPAGLAQWFTRGACP